MIAFADRSAGLSTRAIAMRVAIVAAALAFAATLRSVDPAGVAGNSWLFPVSCGAVTGVPCVFCGMTRAFHYLMHGELARALYFNWLVFPSAAAAGVVLATLAAEAVTGRRLIRVAFKLEITPRVVAASLATLLVLWSLNVYLAVSGHKAELLNPRGPLYALFVG